MMRRTIFLMLLFFIFEPIIAQKKIALNGLILDSGTRKTIPDVSIASREDYTIGAICDEKGYFSIELPAGENTLIISHINYKTKEVTINIAESTSVEWMIDILNINLEEAVITSNKPQERLKSVQIGVERLEVDKLFEAPTFFGQSDIIRTLSLLPGIKSESDVSSGFQVRGGTSSQNLVLLDGAPVYNAGHLMGIFSVFNDDIVSSASLYKGLMGAELGGGSSSVLEISTNGGVKNKFSGSADLGLLSSSIYLETPIVEDKLSLWVSGRRSYYDLFLKLSEEYKNNTIYFYDINAKLEAKLSNKDRLSLSIFSGKDDMLLEEITDLGWTNLGSSIHWFHRYRENLTSKTSLILSKYDSEVGVDYIGTELGINGSIYNYGLKHNYDWSIRDHKMRFGLQGSYISLVTGDWIYRSIHNKEKSQGLDLALYISDSWKITPNFEMMGGLRLSLFAPTKYNLIKGGVYTENEWGLSQAYLLPEPRFTMNYQIFENQSIKGGYSRLTQNIHALKNLSMSLPFDRYSITGGNISPQISDQISIGYSFLTKDLVWEFTFDSYYKKIQGIYDYREGYNFTSDIIMENIISAGKGRSFGVEALIKKNSGKLTGWIGYTLAKTENKIAGINNGRWYPSTHDRRHDFSVVGMYDLGNNWSGAISWVYNTGQALTAPSAKYQLGGQYFYYYTERNGYRAPNYHRLDLSFTYKREVRNFLHEITFGVYNLYNRHNPFMITFEEDIESVTGTTAIQTSLFGILPSISYSIKF